MTAGTKKKTTTQKSSTKKKANVKKKSEVRTASPVRREVVVWIALAFCVILLISSFGLGGKAGRGLSSFFFGIFGIPAYILPFALFFLTALLAANPGNRQASKRAVYSFCFLFALCGFIQLLAMPFEKSARIISYYAYSASEKRGGGLLGGLLVKLLYPLFGRVATYIILITLMIIFLVLITEKAILRYVKNGFVRSGKNIQAHHEERLRNQKELQKQRQKEREEEKEAGRQEKKIEKPERKPQKRAASMQEITIHRADLPDETDLTPHEQKPSSKAGFKQDRFDFCDEDPDQTTEFPTAAVKQAAVQPVVPEKVTKKESAEAFADVSKEIAEKEDAAPPQAYRFPSLSLLKKGTRKKQGMGDAALRETAAKLERTLESFGVRAAVTNVSCGPSVTRYELQPQEGVKVSRILNLADDIKLNLAVADIRIEAPIPGKAAVGIEVPNAHNVSIMLRDLLESSEFKNHPSKIAFAVGMDIVGKIVVADIYKMPHLLIGGATGSGKSVCINTLIMSILYKAKPDEVKFIMIDPKMIELNLYNGIPHLYIPVVTDPKKAAGALQWAVAEMTKRYKLFADLGVRDLRGYNTKVQTLPPSEEDEDSKKPMPQIVIVVDEFADLMMVASGDVEEAVCRLAQLARAAGIHLILATQRPSVDVITGLIKANMPSRIALAVSSGVDSRTIIDMVGAEKLLGKGDMLFYPQSYPKPVRIQGAFVSEEEVEAVCDFIRQQNGDADYDSSVNEAVAANANGCGKNSSSGAASFDTDGQDEYFADAGRFIIEKDKASIGMLQRNFKIGFNRAARIMDALSDAGVVGPEEGTKPRRILMDAAQFEQYLDEQQA